MFRLLYICFMAKPLFLNNFMQHQVDFTGKTKVYRVNRKLEGEEQGRKFICPIKCFVSYRYKKIMTNYKKINKIKPLLTKNEDILGFKLENV